MKLIIFHETRFQPFANQFQHSTVANALFNQLHQLLVWYVAKVAANVDIDDPVHALSYSA
ncbi:hypothetical protein [Paenibacillus piri]|uniref:hypothetical protein n=1 Tax=Paenibacillus piri TaxID=2547395 RepID=UPI001FE50474|nr:hypothetical protein [Paenibacillus piri]